MKITTINSTDDIKKWMNDNLVGVKEGAELTEQSVRSFRQSVTLGTIKPFFEDKNEYGVAKVRLYYKEDLIEYKKNKRIRPTNKKKD